MDARSGDGDITLSGVKGSATAHTGDGNIQVSAGTAPVKLTSGDGRIEVHVGATGDGQSVSAHTGDGSITVYLPASFVGEVEATTGDGRLQSDFPLTIDGGRMDGHHLRGTVGSASVNSARVTLSTGDGGEAWDTATLPAGTAVATLDCATPSVCWVGGTSGGIFGPAYLAESSDGGHSWQPSSLPTGLPGVAGLSCSGPGDCLAVTADADLVADPVKGSAVIRLVGTTEGGRWQRVGTIPPVWAPTGVGDTTSATPQLLHCTGAGHCLLATADERGGAPSWRGRVLATTDGGHRWTVAGKSPDSYQALDAIACPGVDTCVGVGSGRPDKGAGVIATTAAGTHPAVVAIPGGVGNLYGVTCPGAARCVAVGTALGSAAALVSADGGRTWRPASLPPWLAAASTTG